MNRVSTRRMTTKEMQLARYSSGYHDVDNANSKKKGEI